MCSGKRCFRTSSRAAFQRKPLVYFTYGLCEPHGPQNALGLDELKAHRIACLTAQRHGGIVAPPDYWHIHEIGGYAVWSHAEIGTPPHTWLTAMPPWQHFKNVCYHIRAADALGFHAAILLTGHYGPNWEDLKTLVDLLQPLVGTRLYALPEFESNHNGFSGDGSQTGDHAGKVETSLLWALRPELVDVSRIPPHVPGEVFAMGRDAHEADRWWASAWSPTRSPGCQPKATSCSPITRGSNRRTTSPPSLPSRRPGKSASNRSCRSSRRCSTSGPGRRKSRRTHPGIETVNFVGFKER